MKGFTDGSWCSSLGRGRAGWLGKERRPQLRQRKELRTGVHLRQQSAQPLTQYRGLYPQAQACDSYEQLLADPNIDALALVTPAPAHASMARQALLAGKHVFVEKPMALTEADALELCELSEAIESEADGRPSAGISSGGGIDQTANRLRRRWATSITCTRSD